MIEKDGEVTLKNKSIVTFKQQIYERQSMNGLTLLILLLLSAVRKDMLLISFITTKFCSSRLKFYKVAQSSEASLQRGHNKRFKYIFGRNEALT